MSGAKEEKALRGNRRRDNNPRCPECLSRSSVIETVSPRRSPDGHYSADATGSNIMFSRTRRYECEKGHVFSTIETIKITPAFKIHRVKHGKELVDDFDFDKLAKSVKKSNEKMNDDLVVRICHSAVDMVTKTGEFTTDRRENGVPVYTSAQLGNAVLKAMHNLSNELLDVDRHDSDECVGAIYRYVTFFNKIQKVRPLSRGLDLLADAFRKLDAADFERLSAIIGHETSGTTSADGDAMIGNMWKQILSISDRLEQIERSLTSTTGR